MKRCGVVVLASFCLSLAFGQVNRELPSVPEDTMQKLLVHKAGPVLNLGAEERIQGRVILKVMIDKEGNVSNLQLVSGHPMLAPAAIEAVRQWKYTPYELNGETVEVDTTVQVNFKLADDPPNRGVPYAAGPET